MSARMLRLLPSAKVAASVNGVLAALDLVGLARETPAEDLPSLLGRLAEAEGIVRMRLTTPAVTANGHQEAEPSRWITPSEAAAIAKVPVERLYAWAKGQRWASRPSRRCLRIDEQPFRRWLGSRH